MKSIRRTSALVISLIVTMAASPLPAFSAAIVQARAFRNAELGGLSGLPDAVPMDLGNSSFLTKSPSLNLSGIPALPPSPMVTAPESAAAAVAAGPAMPQPLEALGETPQTGLTAPSSETPGSSTAAPVRSKGLVGRLASALAAKLGFSRIFDNSNSAASAVADQSNVPTVAAVPPGKDLLPHFSDPVRVGVILKIISAVYSGKPLPFPKDGVVFDDSEGLLPSMPLGYYHEYTVLPPAEGTHVVTIGEKTYSIEVPPPGNRGAERLIIGGGKVLYYTPDHYQTFIQLQVLP
jgi:ribonuclease T1